MNVLVTPARVVFLSLLLFCFLGPHAAVHAQIPNFQMPLLEQATLQIEPRFPGPNQEVTAIVTSTVLDLNQANITWTINGASVQPSQEQKRLTFTTDESSATTVTATIRTSDGAIITRELQVRPSALDLLWQANSYTPPFYRGKGLATAGSTITLQAIPAVRNTAGRTLEPSELVFTWKQNGRVLSAVSGRGKSSVTLNGPELYKRFDITVEATSLDQSVGATAALTLGAAAPRILFYENHPTLGVQFERALVNSLEIAGGEVSITAEPYFFTTMLPGIGMRYDWKVNGQTVQNPSVNPSQILLRPTGAGGQAQVTVSAQNVSNVFQRSQQTFDISFTGDLTL